MHRLLTASLALAALAAGAWAAPIPLAETDLGPITTDDLWFQIDQGPGLPGDSFDNPAARRLAENLLRHAAIVQITDHLFRERGLNTDPALQARFDLIPENQRLSLAERHLFPRRAVPTDEEIQAHLDSHRAEYRLPDVAWWRFMRFQNPERAQEAHEALRAGEDFASVSARLASPPIQGEPGAVIGPAEFEGQIMPVLENALRTSPIGEPTEIIETPVGRVILQVEQRDLDRWPEESRMWETARAEAAERLLAERQTALLTELSARFPVEIPESVASASPEDTVAIRVGDLAVTVGDLRRRAQAESDPEAALERALALPIRGAAANRLLLVAEADRRGLFDNPEFETRVEWLRAEHVCDFVLDLLEGERLPVPSDEELSAAVIASAEAFETELADVDSLWITGATLSERASSDLALPIHLEAAQIRERLLAGENARALFEEIRNPEHQDELEEWDDIPLQLLPWYVRDLAVPLAPSEVSPPRMTPWGALLVRVRERHTGVPELRWIRGQATALWRRAQLPGFDLEAQLLEEFGYQPLVAVERLRLDEIGAGIAVLENESPE